MNFLVVSDGVVDNDGLGISGFCFVFLFLFVMGVSWVFLGFVFCFDLFCFLSL